MPLISIVIPLYNKVNLIKSTLKSILSQPFDDYEIVVVDDGSTDNSGYVVCSIDDSRIHYYRKENGGVSSARNYGIERSLGDWLLFVDADDQLTDESLATFDEILKCHPNVEFIVGAFRGKCGNDSLKQNRFVHNPYYEIWRRRLYARPGSMLVKRRLIEQYGAFDTRLSFYEDYEFAIRLMLSKNIYQTDKEFSIYSDTVGGLSSSSHPIEKEMAYYIPQMKIHSFWHKVLLYENLQLAKLWWQGHEKETAYYNEVERKCFGKIFVLLHWIRQKMIRRGMI